MDSLVAIARYSTVETERLNLRPFTFSDSHAFYEISQDIENLDYIFPARASLAESDYLLVHAFLKNPIGRWAIEDKSSLELLGAITFDKMDFGNRTAEIGYFIKKRFQGNGLATETLKIISYLSFKEFGLKKLYVVTHLENIASQRVAQKSGFRLKRQYKGSDRYTHKMRHYLEFELDGIHYE